MSYVLSQPHPWRLRRFFAYNYNDAPVVIYSPRVFRPYRWSYPVTADWLSPATYIRSWGDKAIDDVSYDDIIVDKFDIENKNDPDVQAGLELLRTNPGAVPVVHEDGTMTTADQILGPPPAGTAAQAAGTPAVATVDQGGKVTVSVWVVAVIAGVVLALLAYVVSGRASKSKRDDY